MVSAAATSPGPALPALGHATAGSTGAAISNICTYPLALIITRLQIQRQLRKTSVPSHHRAEYKSISDAVYQIYHHEGGLAAFYVGLVHDTVKTIVDSFLFFLCYTFLRQSRHRSRRESGKHFPVVDELGIGFLAGALAKLITTPLANIVTQKQSLAMVSGTSSPRGASSSTRSIALQIKTEKGLIGFWSGYSASLILTLNPSLTFFLFESFKRVLLSRDQRQNPSARATFLLAAISKAVASTVTYPFSLAKARAQASSVVSNFSREEKTNDEDAVGLNQRKRAIATSMPNDVFSVLWLITKEDGIGALYEGLGGEVLKGFFSHGITILVKERSHKLIVQLYYVVLKLLKRYPSPQEVAETANKGTNRIINAIDEQSQQTYADAKQIVEGFGAKSKQNLYEIAEKSVSHIKDRMK